MNCTYLEVSGWKPEWITTAVGIMKKTYKEFYATTPSQEKVVIDNKAKVSYIFILNNFILLNIIKYNIILKLINASIITLL